MSAQVISRQIAIRRHRDGSVTVRIPREEIMRAQRLIPDLGRDAIARQLGDTIVLRVVEMLTPKKPTKPSLPRPVQ